MIASCFKCTFGMMRGGYVNGQMRLKCEKCGTVEVLEPLDDDSPEAKAIDAELKKKFARKHDA